MKKIILIATMLLLTACSQTQSREVEIQGVSPMPELNIKKDKQVSQKKKSDNRYRTLNFSEQKAVWISYIDLATMFESGSENGFEKAFSLACENIKDLGCNTVYVHVRAFGDAYYESDFFVWSKSITGKIGKEPSFDPLQIMVKVAHDNGLSFHAWINPLRCETTENMDIINSDNVIKQWVDDTEKYDEYIVKVKEDVHYWLNPAVEDVRNFISDGVGEIVKKYDVDGIHIDDYFYPTTQTYFDAGTYVETDVALTLSDWRLDNCSKLVKQIYDTIKAENSEVLFGVSPQGNIENNYEYMYADIKRWCSEEGYIDYIVPQVYFGYDNANKPFLSTIDEWSEVVTLKDISLVIGLAPYKIGIDDEYTETVGIIANQIEDCMELDNYSGAALYNYVNIFQVPDDLSKRVEEDKEKIRDLLK